MNTGNDSEMDVLVVSPEFPPNCGGIGQLVFNFVKGSSLSMDVLTEGGSEEVESIPGADIYTVSSMAGLKGVFNCYSHLKSQADNYDLIYFGHPFHSAAASHLKIKYVTHVHGNEILAPDLSQRPMKAIAKYGIKRSDGVIANSCWTKDRVVEMGITSEKVTQIPPGVPSNLGDETSGTPIADADNLPTDIPVLLTVGRLVKRKGHELVLKAIKDLNVRYIICGAGDYEAQLRETAENIGVTDKVRFEGYVSRDRLMDYYASSDIFIMPSQYLKDEGAVEGFGIVFLEANSFGLPVIGSCEGGVPSAINHRQSGLIVSATVPDVHEAIRKLINDGDLYETLSQGARKWANKHTWDKISRDMDQYLIETTTTDLNGTL